jgi:hypothetical protein
VVSKPILELQQISTSFPGVQALSLAFQLNERQAPPEGQAEVLNRGGQALPCCSSEKTMPAFVGLDVGTQGARSVAVALSGEQQDDPEAQQGAGAAAARAIAVLRTPSRRELRPVTCCPVMSSKGPMAGGRLPWHVSDRSPPSLAKRAYRLRMSAR